MFFQDKESVSFLGWNIILICCVLLLIFGYLVMLIRKRWKQGFVHRVKDNPKSPK
jgi:hypothetical protein